MIKKQFNILLLCLIISIAQCSDMISNIDVNESSSKENIIRGIDPIIEWEWTGSAVDPNSYQVMMTPIVANYNDDNGDGFVNQNDIPDIIFVSFEGSSYRTNGTLRVISGDGSGELLNLSNTLGYNFSPGCSLAVGDIDNDNNPEIIGIASNRICCIENDGNLKWYSSADGFPFQAEINIYDIDCDGVPEILVNDRVLNSTDGSVRLTLANTSASLSAFDLDMDGTPELIGGSYVYANDGTLLWSLSSTAAYVAVANMDSDNYPEIIFHVVDSGLAVYCYEHDGTLKWGPVSTGAGGRSKPLIANIDGEGYPEIIVTNYIKIVAIDYQGNVLWESPIQDMSSGSIGCTAMDFDDNGIVEILINDEQYFRMYNGETGDIIYEMEVGNGTLFEVPVIADVDNDNHAEIIITANNYVFDYGHHGLIIFGDSNNSWMNTTNVWNQNEYFIDNVDQDSGIPATLPYFWLTHNSFRQAPGF